MEKIKNIIKKINFKKILIYLFILILIIGVFVFYINNMISGAAKNKVFENVEKIPFKENALLLGTSKIFWGNPNGFYETRLNAVTKLYKNNKIKKILISGDRNEKINYSEPDDMKKDLIKRGVNENDIILDYYGYRTLDSVVRANKIFNLNDYIIISQKFHCERAIYIAENKGQKAICFRANDVPGVIAKKVYAREKFARVKTWLDINILKKQPRVLDKK